MMTLTLPCSYFIRQPPGNPKSLRARGDPGPASSSSPCAAPARAATKPETTGAVRWRPSLRDARPAFFHFQNPSAAATMTAASLRRVAATGTGQTGTTRATTWRVAHGRGRRGGTLTSAATVRGGSARQKTVRARQAMMPSAPPRARPAAGTADERKETQRRRAPSP